MAVNKQRVAIISFDGLSAMQFERLLPDMPALQSLAKGGHLAELDAAPFSDAQPIWAEILTGEPWYRNGCAGYAKPVGSLTDLKLLSENDLLVKANLLPEVAEGQHNVVINVPLLEAREGERKWLADAGSPTLIAVSPASLATDEPFKSYKPRPIISMGKAMADPRAAATFISAESQRLQCATSLGKKSDWKAFIYRTSIFDQLSHLLGIDFLDDQLQISSALRELIARFDSAIYDTICGSEKIVFMSAFSHTRCQEMLSLNDIFQHHHLLKRADKSSNEDILRKQAFAAISSESATPLVSAENQILPAETICASPVRGAVYLNSTDRFADGIVSVTNIRQYKEEIHTLLTAEMQRFSGIARVVCNKERTPLAPDFVIDIAGTDLVDRLRGTRSSYDPPHSVHASTGFVLSKATNSKPVIAVELIELIADLA